MLISIVFAVWLFLASGFAIWRGGAPERCVTILFVVAFGVSAVTPLASRYTYASLNVPMFGVDLLLLVALVAVALAADRFWPMWVAALQLMSIGAHGVRLYDPAIVPGAYWWVTSYIGFPMMGLVTAGLWRHRARLVAGHREYGWTFQRLRSGHERASARETKAATGGDASGKRV